MASLDATPQDNAYPPGYPAEWEFDGLLRSGEAVVVRPIRPSDASALLGLHATVSPGALHHHVLLSAPTLSLESAARFTEVDYNARMAFVAVVSDELVGLASYARSDTATLATEAGFIVTDAYQRQGVATLLFETLAEYARTRGILRFLAGVKAQNAAMLEMFAATGLHCTRREGAGTVRVEIDLRPTPAYRAACDEREATAEVASIAEILRPGSIAVVGAGRKPGNVGHQVVRSLLVGDFAGTVYPVNPSARAVCGVPAYPALLSIPEPVHLAVVAVPASSVPGVIEEAASAGVRAVTIITAGFGETGRSGAAVETDMLSVARRNGMRIVGPNCLGVVNTDPGIRMNATFTSLEPLPGRLALISQSGAVGVVLGEETTAAGLGLSAFVSVGNKLDVSPNDLLCFFEDDDRTSVIALYLESLGNPRKFARIARRVGATKPIVALKAGRTSAGARGARSHTAAAATPEVTVAALLQSAGVIKVDRLEELLDVSAILLAAPLPAGRRVALVGNSGGPLILAADACEGGELTVPELCEATQHALGEILAPAAAAANPVDLTADGTADMLERALGIVLADDAIDAVITVVIETLAISAAATRETIARVAQRVGKPVVVCSVEADAAGSSAATAQVAELPSPERAATALGHVCRYAQWRRRPLLPAGDGGDLSDRPAIGEIVAAQLASSPEGGWLPLDQAALLLAACGLPVLPTRGVTSAADAAAEAERVGFPVVLKARSGDVVHKTEVGGVALGLEDPDAVRAAYAAMEARLGAKMGGAVIQPTAPSGVEAIVGLASDPEFGPVVMVGLGGVLTDLLGDRQFAVPPLEPGAADAMVAALRAAPLLDGYRGAPKVDRQALIAVLDQVARVAEEVPELIELDLNPILVTAEGALIVDCKARLAPRPLGPGPLFPALRRRPRA
ncbi:MAG: GNAT family N-acetyltransferase [Streptosporangiaceae bacterium]|jgi:acyl-CoA synthetase (NDP forming)/GNAT superfamily N-acetyltransferase